MNCEVCRGACCEFVLLDVQTTLDPDTQRWFDLHTTTIRGHRCFESKCSMLSDKGRCNIYADRPKMCVDFEVGGERCIEAVLHRRTPEQFEQIKRGYV